MLGCYMKTQALPLTYLFHYRSQYFNAQVRSGRRINAPLLRAIALALRKFAANSTPASPVYEKEWKLHCKIKHGFWIMKLHPVKRATTRNFSTKRKRVRKWRNIIFKCITYARWLMCALEILICIISYSNLRQIHWKKSCLIQMR